MYQVEVEIRNPGGNRSFPATLAEPAKVELHVTQALGAYGMYLPGAMRRPGALAEYLKDHRFYSAGSGFYRVVVRRKKDGPTPQGDEAADGAAS